MKGRGTCSGNLRLQAMCSQRFYVSVHEKSRAILPRNQTPRLSPSPPPPRAYTHRRDGHALLEEPRGAERGLVLVERGEALAVQKVVQKRVLHAIRQPRNVPQQRRQASEAQRALHPRGVADLGDAVPLRGKRAVAIRGEVTEAQGRVPIMTILTL